MDRDRTPILCHTRQNSFNVSWMNCYCYLHLLNELLLRRSRELILAAKSYFIISGAILFFNFEHFSPLSLFMPTVNGNWVIISTGLEMKISYHRMLFLTLFIVKTSAMNHSDQGAMPNLRCYKCFHNCFPFFKVHVWSNCC